MKNNFFNNKRVIATCAVILLILMLAFSAHGFSHAQGANNAINNLKIPNVDIKIDGNDGNFSSSIQIVIMMTILALLPAIVLLMTPFTRIIIIFSFLRRALGLQTTPPNQVLIGLSLFLTLFIMNPILGEIYEKAYLPLSNGTITQEQAYTQAIEPMREFMFKQVRKDDLALFVKLESGKKVESLQEVNTVALIPAYIISELKTSFIVGFKLFVPFMVIDMVVASTLMALGMMMLPPVMISLPFKILIFVLVDGWNLLTHAIMAGFNL